MKVFVEMPEDGVGYPCFAFFDTITGSFDCFLGEQHWESYADLAETVERTPGTPKARQAALDRYWQLIPERYGGKSQ